MFWGTQCIKMYFCDSSRAVKGAEFLYVDQLTEVSPFLSVITLNVNDSTLQSKDRDWQNR